MAHENILYKACDYMGVISIFYDFSMGYPGLSYNNRNLGTTKIDLNRNPSYIITFGEQRCNQYRFKKIKNSGPNP